MFYCDLLRDLIPFTQFKKRKKHPWSSAACNFNKSSTPSWVFSRFLNCTDGTRSRKASHLVKIYFDLN